MRWTCNRSLLPCKDFKLKSIAYNLLEGELSILKQLENFLGKKSLREVWGKLLFPLQRRSYFCAYLPKIRKNTFNTTFCVKRKTVPIHVLFKKWFKIPKKTGSNQYINFGFEKLPGSRNSSFECPIPAPDVHHFFNESS
jgi:hypothetical protein